MSITIEMLPITERRFRFDSVAVGELAPGDVVALTGEPDSGRGVLAQVETVSLVRVQSGTTPRAPRELAALLPGERIMYDYHTEGIMTLLAQFDKGTLEGELTVRPTYKKTHLVEPPLQILKQYFGMAPPASDSSEIVFHPVLNVGCLMRHPEVPVAFNAVGFNRHTALLAQSGSGKSYAIGVLLEELITKTQVRIIVLDPNSDFVRLGDLTDETTADVTLRDKYTNAMKGVAIVDSYPKGFQETLTQLLDGKKRAAILDLGSLDSSEQLSFGMKLLQPLWERREAKKPTIVVLDEAHNFASTDERASGANELRDLIIRIAGEGRKYGLWMIVASQRPQKLHANVIGLCDNLILMKLSSKADGDYVSSAFTALPSQMIEIAYGLQTGEAIVVGRIVRSPTLTKFRTRLTSEGGGDISNDWAREP
jgi:hypothetical protein